MTRERRRCACAAYALVLSIAALSASAAVAKDDAARQEQLRRLYGERTDQRCAAEGPGFVYAPEARTCVRIGGLVGVQGSASTGR